MFSSAFSQQKPDLAGQQGFLITLKYRLSLSPSINQPFPKYGLEKFCERRPEKRKVLRPGQAMFAVLDRV